MSSASSASSHREGKNQQVYGHPGYTSAFPVCRAAGRANTPQTLYADSLLPTGNGYPLLDPDSNYPDDEKQRAIGLRIGDVGFLNGAGRFSVLVNIFHSFGDDRRFLPREHEDLQPPFSQWEVRRLPHHFPPGTVLAPEGVLVTKRPGSELRIQTLGKTGGFVAFPDGGSREDLVDVDALQPHVEKHSLDWYRFANYYRRGPGELRISNGDLYLITGVDTAPRWTTGLVTSDSPPAFGYDLAENDLRPGLALRPMAYSVKRPVTRGDIFIRGLRIALGTASWTRYFPSLPPHGGQVFVVLSSQADHSSRNRLRIKLQALRRKPEEGRTKQDTYPTHPAVVILQLMLDKALSANVLVAHDSIWASKPEINLQYPSIFDHIAQIFDGNTVVIKDGLAVLTPNDDTSPKRQTLLNRLIGIASHGKRRVSSKRQRKEIWRTIIRDDPI